uniref:Uncharacterized protein n=1 Tax=Oryza australiensis TaxID=4532 RepID=A0A1V1H5V1_9ORYZ|nr:hypothetical protein [Oryza australiensis]
MAPSPAIHRHRDEADQAAMPTSSSMAVSRRGGPGGVTAMLVAKARRTRPREPRQRPRVVGPWVRRWV